MPAKKRSAKKKRTAKKSGTTTPTRGASPAASAADGAAAENAGQQSQGEDRTQDATGRAIDSPIEMTQTRTQGDGYRSAERPARPIEETGRSMPDAGETAPAA